MKALKELLASQLEPAFLRSVISKLGDAGTMQITDLDSPEAEALEVKIEELSRVMSGVIQERLGRDQLATECVAAVAAGRAAFKDVYVAVWKSVEASEPDGVRHMRRALADMNALLLGKSSTGPANDGQQQAKDALSLYTSAAAVRPLASSVVRRLAVAEITSRM